MKLTKPLFTIIAGLIVFLPGLLQAGISPGSISISGGASTSPQVAGTTNWIQYTANITHYPVSSACEAMPAPTNTTWSWSSTYGTWVTSTNNPAYWTNVFTTGGWYTNAVTNTVTWQGVDCQGTNYTVSTNACVTNVIEVVSVTLSSVAFNGGNHVIYSDSDGSPYPTTQWIPTTNYPVCYTRNHSMTVNPTFVVNPSSLPILVKGISSGPQLPIGSGTSPTLTSTNNFANNVDFLNPMTIDWQVSLDNGNNWKHITTSANKVYVTLNDPTCATLFHTVVDVACRNTVCKSVEADVVAGVWGIFASESVMMADGSGPMKYWGQISLNNKNNANNAHLPDLMQYQDGKCGAWQEFFAGCLAAHGISSSLATIVPYSPYNVMQIYPPANNPVTMIGQGGGPPNATLQYLFLNHAVVLYGGWIYDPSYGRKYNYLINWENASLQGVSAPNPIGFQNHQQNIQQTTFSSP